MSLLDFIGLPQVLANGSALVTRRALNFVGATVIDDPINERTVINVGGGGGGGGASDSDGVTNVSSVGPAASVSDALELLATQITARATTAALNALTSVVNGKAAQAALDALTLVVDSKAATSALTSLANTVAGKAAQTALDALTLVVGGKAPADAEYLVAVASSGLTAERVLAVSGGLGLVPAAGLLTIDGSGLLAWPAWTVASIAEILTVDAEEVGRVAHVVGEGEHAFYVLVAAEPGSGAPTWYRLATEADATSLASSITNIQNNLLPAKADAALTANPQAGSYTLTVDAPKQLTRMNSATANTLTAPPDAANIPLNQPAAVLRAGAGITTIIAGVGVTLRPANNLRLVNQWDMATITKIGANEYLVKGEVSV